MTKTSQGSSAIPLKGISLSMTRLTILVLDVTKTTSAPASEPDLLM